MSFKITIEGKNSIERVQRSFERELSSKEIVRETAKALNSTAKRVQGFIRKEIKSSYTMNQKYLERMSYVKKFANPSELYSEVAFNYRPVPMIAFNHSGGKKGGVMVNIRKGKAYRIPGAFIVSMRGTKKSGEHYEHEGIFAAGRYIGKKFVFEQKKTPSGKTRITELKSASPFTMGTTKNMQPKINSYVDKNLPHTLNYFLKRKLVKISRGN
jgi:hypothetical protein